MDNEKINTITAILDESENYRKKLMTMKDESEKMRKYCLDAIDDFRTIYDTAKQMVQKHPKIASPVNDKLGGYVVGDNGHSFRENGNGAICNVKINGDLCDNGLLPSYIYPESFEQTRKSFETIETSAEGWRGYVYLADKTRILGATILNALYVSAVADRDHQRKIFSDIMEKSSKTYTPIKA